MRNETQDLRSKSEGPAHGADRDVRRRELYAPRAHLHRAQVVRHPLPRCADGAVLEEARATSIMTSVRYRRATTENQNSPSAESRENVCRARAIVGSNPVRSPLRRLTRRARLTHKERLPESHR